MMALAVVQSMSFSVVSRARNRDNLTYHAVASVVSNFVWFVTMRELVVSEMSFDLAIPYIAGMTVGSIAGSLVSVKIESMLHRKQVNNGEIK